MKHSIQFWIASGIAFCTLATTSSTKAQIVPDATLPNNSSVTTEGNTSIITQGTRAGGNLFHSFEQFSLPTGSTAYFNNALDIQNIISRVTGSSASNIDGLIQAKGAANLFLLNPNGILFGPNATLSIGGSFIASTASAVNFADGNQFSATAHPTTPLLTVSVPLGLQFAGNAGSIQVQGNGQGIRKTTDLIDTNFGLRVQSDQTLALVGGNVALEGGTLKTDGGRIELGSVAGPGLVSLLPIDKGWALGYEGIQTYGNIQLFGAAAVDASGEGGGDVQVRGRRVTIQDGSNIEASTLGAEPGGNLNVTASESVELSGITADGFSTGLFTQVYPGASGAGGNLTIETGRLNVRDGAQVAANTYDTGPAGTLLVIASESVELIGTSEDGSLRSGLFTQGASGAGGNLTVETGRLTVRDGAFVSTSTQGTGSGGNLAIATGQLIVQDGAQVQAATFGDGQAGNLVVKASDVELIGTTEDKYTDPTGLFTSVDSEATGNGGNLTIETRRLSVRNGAQVAASTFGAGNGGILTINASDFVELSGALPTATEFSGSSGVFVSAEPGATGNVGNLSITTGQLIVQNGAKISADNFGTGQGGNATLNVRQLIARDGGLVRAGSLRKDGSFGGGAGGTLSVNAAESVEVSGSGTIGSNLVNSTLSTATETTGDAGNLRISTGNLTVRDGAEVTVSSTGSGRAGNLQIIARSIRLDNKGALTATTQSGNGGDIRLQAQDLMLLRRNSQISTRAGSEETGGNGGSITIETDNLVAPENSDIDANAFGGTGGQVRINAQGIFGTEERTQQTPKSDITASSNLGPQFSGRVEIDTPDVDPSQGLVELPAELVDASNQIATACAVGGESVASNKFTITGRGGLPPNPREPLGGEAVLTNWATLTGSRERGAGSRESTSTNSAVSEGENQIVEATGWVIGSNGEVILTAQAPSVNLDIPWLTPSTCSGS